MDKERRVFHSERLFPAESQCWSMDGNHKALDREEKQILSAFESDKLKSAVMSGAALRRYRKYARATLSKNEWVNIRLSTPDMSEIQARAAEEGIPYQTLIASVLHKFVAGRLTEKPSRLMTYSTGRGKKCRDA